MTDSIGLRMKAQYEDRTRYLLPRRTWTIIRVDGKAFHTFTRDACRPFDYKLMDDLDTAAKSLCAQAMGVKCAYGQSDEYSFLLTDFETPATEAWFDGNIQKIASISASIFTEAFPRSGANFDARVFTIPDPQEVLNYFIWRQQDATRNAILMAGNAEFSPKQMHGLNVNQVQEKLFSERGINFDDYPTCAKRGRVVYKESYLPATATQQGTQTEGNPYTKRSRWAVDQSIPIFTADRDYFQRVMGIPMVIP